MGLFTKKKSDVPELPPAPSLPELPRLVERKGIPELPSFPGSSRNENLNREIVKSAVTDDSENIEVESENLENENHLEFPSLPTKPIEAYPKRLFELGQFSEASKKIKSEPEPLPIKVIEPRRQIRDETPMTRPSEPIFVRIDKFQSSQDSFQKILNKVTEIEKTLEKIRSVKQQEEEELDKWSQEVEQLKSRLSDIDDNIFSQI